MPHVERLTVSTLPAPPGYTHVAVATGALLVLTAGAVPLDAEGHLVGAGASGDDVLKTTVYIASANRADLIAARDVIQKSAIATAASTLLGEDLLGYTDQRVEIEGIAALP